MQGLMSQMRSGEIAQSDMPKMMKALHDTFASRLGKIFTDEQKEQLEAMKGKPFKFAAPGQ